MVVVGKFGLMSVVESKDVRYKGSGSDGKPQYTVTPAAQIKMSGVQSAPFGDATPYAQMEMHIRHGGASEFFTEPWRKYIRNADNTSPQFYVAFMDAAEYEAFRVWRGELPDSGSDVNP